MPVGATGCDSICLIQQILCERVMTDHELQEQAEALLEILELGQEDIRQGRYTSVEEVFAELDALDQAEPEGTLDQQK
jgi:hypothetical protein